MFWQKQKIGIVFWAGSYGLIRTEHTITGANCRSQRSCDVYCSCCAGTIVPGALLFSRVIMTFTVKERMCKMLIQSLFPHCAANCNFSLHCYAATSFLFWNVKKIIGKNLQVCGVCIFIFFKDCHHFHIRFWYIKVTWAGWQHIKIFLKKKKKDRNSALLKPKNQELTALVSRQLSDAWNNVLWHVAKTHPRWEQALK